MTAIVENVQKTGVESGIITLYKLEYADNTFAYFVAGVEEDLSSIQFRDEDGTIRTYTPIPIELEGFDISSDGAISRPKMTVANIESTFRDSLGGLGFEDLIGRRITRRTTQQKYLVGESGDTLSGSVKWDLILQDSSDNSSFSAVTDNKFVSFASVDSSGIYATIDAASEDDASYPIGYHGPNRYFRVACTKTGTHSNGTPLGATGLTMPIHMPASGSDDGTATG